VIWDDLPVTFDEAQVHIAADLAIVLEKEAVSLTGLADVFKQDRGDAVPAEAGLLLLSDGLACALWLTEGESTKRWGPLGPFMEWPDAGVYPPPVATFPDALLPYLELRASTTTRADLKARYHDLIALRWRKFEHAREAHRAYLEAAAGAAPEDDTSAMLALSYLLRASDLSLSHGIDEEATITALRAEVLRGLSRENSGNAFWIALRASPLIARRPGVARELVDAIEAEARQIPENRRHRERALLEAAEKLARAIGDADRARGLRLDQARSYEAEAKERLAEGGIIELALLNDASALYGQVGAGADVQRMKPMLAAASVRASEGMHLIESQVDIPQSAIEDAATDITVRLGTAELLALGTGYSLGLWPQPERVEDALSKAMTEHPFQFLVNRTSISGDGRYQPDPDTEAQKHEARLTRQLAQETAFRLALGGSIIEELRHRGLWSARRMFDAVHLVEPGLGDACAPGFEMLEAGRSWLASHALIPQLERAVRLVAKAVGVVPMKRAQRGGLRWASFEDMLDEPAVVDALGARLAMSLRRLYLDPFGPNYRNELAHGATDPAENQTASALLTALAILSVALRLGTVRQRAATDTRDSTTAPD
jgi:hypothetical protein